MVKRLNASNLDLFNIKKEFRNELTGNILKYWVDEVYDPERRIFYGRITNEGRKFKDAPLSAVFTTRIMWTFSAAYRVFPVSAYKKMADEAFRILREMFWDSLNEGIYWSVLPDGTPLDTKKQFYAEAFFVYALSEFYLAFKDEAAKEMAVRMYGLIMEHGFDKEFDGYIEAKTIDWKEIQDMRLSSKELNVKKTMNTHLHILEAFTNLCRIWRTEDSLQQLRHLIQLFLDRIIDSQRYHFHLFFDADWTVRAAIDSYGHDIEGSWLLCEAAEVLGDLELVGEVEQIALKMAAVTRREGLGKEGGVYYEKKDSHLLVQYDWWPQAEAVIGFYNAWQLSGDGKYLELALQCWNFIKRYIVDKKNGEWYWGVSDKLVTLGIDKINDWKGPYHNGRMCMEMMRRIETP